MHIRHFGNISGRPLLLLHGFLESGEVWFSWVEETFSDYSMFIPDLPGHGLSEPWGETKILSDWAEYLMVWIRERQLTDEPIFIMGHSMGGYLALEMAALFPKLSGRMILFNSTPLPDTPEQLNRRMKQIDIIKKGRSRLLTRNVGPAMFAPENRKKLYAMGQLLNATARNCPPAGMLNALKAIMNRRNFIPLCSERQQDVLLFTGDKDPLMNKDYIRLINAKFPELNHRHLEACGHAPFLEQPHSTGKICRDFFTSSEQG